MLSLIDLVKSCVTVKDTYSTFKNKEGAELEESLEKIVEDTGTCFVSNAKVLGAVFIYDKTLKETVSTAIGEELVGVLGTYKKINLVAAIAATGISAVNWAVAKYKLSSIKHEREFIQNCLRIAKEKGYLQ